MNRLHTWLWGAVLLAAGASGNALAQTQSLTKILEPATPTAFAPGATVVYRVTASCNNLVGGCGDLSITDVLPPQLEPRSCNSDAGVGCSFVGNTYTITKSPYNGGDTIAVTLTTRVRLGEGPATNIVNTANATVTNPAVPDAGSSAPPISIVAGTPNWQVRKRRIDPNPALVAPTPGAPVTYQVQLCSVSGIGNVDLDDAGLVDTLPAGTIFVSASDGGVHAPGPNTVTWNIGAVSLAALYGSNAANTTQCISRQVTIDVPGAPTYNVNDVLTNTLNGSITPEGGAAVGIGPATVNDTLVGPVGNANPGKYGNDVAPSAGFTDINWRPTFNTDGSNVPLTDFSFVDVLPPNAPNAGVGPFDLVSIRSGQWPAGDASLGYQIVATLQTAAAPCSATTGTWVTVTGGANIAANANALFTAGTHFPATDGCVRWAFSNTGTGPANEVPRSFSFSTRPQIIQRVPAGTPEGQVTNCSFVRLSVNGVAQTEGPSCGTVNIEPPLASVQIDKTRVGSGQIRPTDEVVFRLSFQHTANDSTGTIVNPTVVDLLPPELEFVSWTNYTYSGPARPQPYLEVLPNYLGSGRDLVRFSWSGSPPPAGALQYDGSPATVANPASFEHTIAANQMPDMEIRVRVRPGTPSAIYTNEMGVYHEAADFTCNGSGTTRVTETLDLDGNGGAANDYCRNSLNFTVVDSAVLIGEKWIQGDTGLANVDDPTDSETPPGGVCPDYGTTYGGVADGFTRYPCVARTDHGGDFVYRARIQNAGNIDLDNYVLYDLLPFVGDTGSGGPLSGTARESRFRPQLTGPVVVENNGSLASAPVVEYTTTANPCRPEVGYNAGCNPATYVPAASVADFGAVTAFRIRDFDPVSGGDFRPLEVITYRVPMRAPASGAPSSVVGNPAIFNPSWNSLAHRANEAGTALMLEVAEPPKVGIILPERYRLGNLVWIDSDNNGIADLAEPGVDGVEVALCRDTDGTPGPSAGDTLVATTITATVGGNAGKYAFDTLLGGSDYYLAIPDGQAVLAGYTSSTNGEEAAPDSDGDNNDNGVNPSGASCAGAAIRSGLVTLGPAGATEPTNEVLRAGSATDDDADPVGGYADALSNYSVDFGFVPLTDLGDLPDTGAGTGAGNYDTLLGNGGASHTIVPGLRFGACVDAEIDGQPNAGADGDDNGASFYTDGTCATPGDDEDGIDTVDLNGLSVYGPAVIGFTATNQTASAALACGYIDFDNDGQFSGSEIASVPVPAGSNNASLSFDFGTVPVGAEGTRYARFRISNDAGAVCDGASASGHADSGEVEDYRFAISLPTDWGDLPAPYATTLADNGARHPIRPGLQIGACVDAEGDGQPNATADGDDNATGTFLQGGCAVAGDDEDGVNIADLLQQVGAPGQVRVNVTNTTGVAAQLCAFVDWNADGDFGDNVGGTPEAVAVPVPNGTNGEVIADFGTLSQAVVPGATYARFRLSSDLGACNPAGAASDGEVEDYPLQITATDLGDLPDSFGTLLASNGPVHTIVPGLYLGAGVDAEANGQPSVNADGDDANGNDDEDGISQAALDDLHRGSPVSIPVTAVNTTGGPALVCGYIDLNADGDFGDAGESAQATLPNGGTGVTLDFGAVPNDAPLGNTYARFRIQTQGACSPNGAATDGEVEDYVAIIGPGELSLGNLVWEDANNNGVVDPGEAGVPNVPVELFLDENDDGVPDGPAIATQTTDGSGNYLFDELVPTTYLVCITAPSTYVGSTGTGHPYAPTGPYEPAPDPDNDADNDDNGTADPSDPTRICSLPVTLSHGDEPTDDGDDSDLSNLSVDFGLLYNFDLALRKTLAAGQNSVVFLGHPVRYTITVFNQGTVTAQNIEITDTLPQGLVLDDPDWNDLGGGVATYLIAGPLLPGEQIEVPLQARADGPLTFGEALNFAEISDARDENGDTPVDIDSTPDGDPDNDGDVDDDETDNANGDEDDSDIAIVVVMPMPTLIPVASPAGLLMLGLMLGLAAVAPLRRRRQR